MGEQRVRTILCKGGSSTGAGTTTFSRMSITLAEVARVVGGELVGDPLMELAGLSSADQARAGDLTFAENEVYFAAAEKSQAAAILVSGPFVSATKALIRVAEPRVALARILPLFHPPDAVPSGIHPSATIDATAVIDATAHIGPNCVVRERVRLGPGVVLMAGNCLGRDCQIGEGTVLHPNAVVYAGSRIGSRVILHAGAVIGSDGYGYVMDGGRHRKVQQIGHVILGDDVEVGANAAIDRGALGATVIGEGTKIDNLVHIANNVVIGRHCLILGQVGFAGSTRVGDYSVVASQSGISGHLKIGSRVVIGAKSGVMRDIPDGGKVLGIPAAPDRDAKRQMIAVTQLPDLIRRVRELERQITELGARRAD